MRIPRTRPLAVAAAALTLGATAPAGATVLHGTVVHHNRHAHSFVVAVRGGGLRAIHARKLPAIGRTVAVRARALRNGTFAATKVRMGRRRTHVRIRGTVSFADRRHGRFVVSANGVSLLVRTHRRRAGASAADTVPSPGTTVEVEADLEANDDAPVAQTVTPTGTDLTIKVEGKVLAVDTTARTIAITADDDAQSGGALTISVPDTTIDLTTITVGSEVELLVALHSDGTFTLLGVAGDDNAQQADDQGEQQGQAVGDHEDGGDQQQSSDQQSGEDSQSGGGDQSTTTTTTTDQQPSGDGGSGGGGSDG
jgi:hypothetical protein